MSPNAQLAALGGLAIILIAIGVWIAFRAAHANPEKKEQKRRLWVNQHGRLGDAVITEATDNTLYYAYSIHGVRYTTSQDISSLKDRLPAEPRKLIGTANLKYFVKNPANSIIFCEKWSGLRVKGEAFPEQPPPDSVTSLQSKTASDA
jgi:hypothetical protein